jgi:hypothetical protein
VRRSQGRLTNRLAGRCCKCAQMKRMSHRQTPPRSMRFTSSARFARTCSACSRQAACNGVLDAHSAHQAGSKVGTQHALFRHEADKGQRVSGISWKGRREGGKLAPWRGKVLAAEFWLSPQLYGLSSASGQHCQLYHQGLGSPKHDARL